MSGYQNPLHAPVHPSRVSQFSTLGNAMSAPPRSAGRRYVPQGEYSPTSKWRNQTGRVQALAATITFDYAGIPNSGMPLRELVARGPYAIQQMMQGANDLVLAGITSKTSRKISFHIRWPGYEHVEWVRSIDLATQSGPITRAQLAGVIAQNFSRFIEKAQFEATRATDWRVGSSGVQLDNIVLLSLRNVFEDAWQAEIALEF